MRNNIESLLKELEENNSKLSIETYNVYRRTGIIISSEKVTGSIFDKRLTLSDGTIITAMIM